MPPKKQAGKKNKNDDWDDEAAEKKLSEKVAALKLKEKEEEEAAAWDDESDDEPPPPPTKNKAKAAFAMLMDDSEDDDVNSDSEPEAEVEEPKVEEKKPAPAPKKQAEKKKEEPKAQDKKKGKKGKKGKKEEEDDDLDAILADLEKPLEKVETGKGKKKGKKEKEESPAAEAEATTPAVAQEKVTEAVAGEAAKEATPDAVDAGDEGKKKKKKKKDKKKGGDEKAEDEGEEKQSEEKKEGEEEGGEEGEGQETGAAKDKKKKKKDKKKEKKKEEEGGKGKKKHVDMIKELLRARQEAEAAEEAKFREEEERLEAIAAAKEEEERIAREKREAEKERKKAAIERKKADGTYMTAKEKEKARLAAAKLEAAGISLPKPGEAPTGERKPIIYMDKRALKKQQMKEQKKLLEQQQQASSAEASSTSTPAPSTPVPTPEPSKEATPEESWDATPEEEEPLEDWEMAEVEAIPKLPVPQAATTGKPAAQAKTVEKRKSQENDDEGSGSSSEESSSDEDSSDDSSSEESSEDEGPRGKETKEQIVERVKARLKKRKETCQSKRSTDHLRAPVICVLGHVDTGKTKMLDTIRRTNVQDGEAGGITQQIGATQVPAEAIKERCKLVRDFSADAVKLPGFLIIDTPGHESFSNLRSRGSSLCDFAILVVDIMHGLEPQTIESLKMLLKRQTPFVIALNKIDRLYGYSSNPRKDVYQHLKSQPQNTQMEFKAKYDEVVVQFAQEGLNVCLSNDKNSTNVEEYTSMVPTSAFLGDGIGNLMSFIVNTTQTKYAEKLSFSEELDASVMEVKSIPGLGTTVDVILVNGRLRVGDILVLTGSDGAIMTPIRELLMPQPLKEMRVKNEYGHFKEVQGAQGVKLLAKGLEKTVAGLPIYIAHNEDEVDILKAEAEAQLSRALTAIKKKPEGVYVMASTLGSLEALLEFLKSQKIPYSNVNIGPVHKKDVQKAAAMKEHKAEYACILAFDVKVERDAQLFADQEGVRIFQADIIYHLEDNFLKYREDLRLAARKENENKAIFPCKLRVLPQHVFNARNPIVCGVVVEAGQLKRGTPLCVPSKEGIFIGAVSSIQRNHEEVPLAKKGDEVCIKIENTTGEAPKLYGRHFNHEDALVSRINRDSIDVCKTYFRDDLSREDWQLVVQLKKLLDIM